METNIGIVCACLPTLWPIIRLIPTSMRSRFSKMSTGRSDSSKPERGNGSRTFRSTDVKPSNNTVTETYSQGAKAKNHKSWYSMAIAREDRHRGLLSEEEMMPIGSVGYVV